MDEKLLQRLDELLDEMVTSAEGAACDRAEEIRNAVDPTNLEEFLSWFIPGE